MTLAVALALLASGCVMGGYRAGPEIREEYLERIEPGITTKGEILTWFGAPEHFTDATTLGRALDALDVAPEDVVGLPFSDVLVFRHTRGRLRGFIALLFNRIEWRVASDTLVVYFDAQDRVLYHGYSRDTDALD
jgi:hypothetical protein